MAAVTVLAPSHSDLALVKLAREIAMDIHPLDTILKQHGIPPDLWETLKETPKFIRLLTSEQEAWGTALNTQERVKLKAAAMMEEWLPELNNRLHDADEALPAKIEGGKLIAKIAGVGERDIAGAPTGERFSITINLGPQVEPLVIEKEIPKIIDHNVVNDV